MKYSTASTFLLLCAHFSEGLAFSPLVARRAQRPVGSTHQALGSDCNENVDAVEATSQKRRNLLLNSMAVLSISSVSIFCGPRAASADVADGNALPQGAAQFSRVLRAKSDLAAVQKRVQESSGEMDKEEWDNVSQFLRKLYGVGDDMKSISGGMYDPQKKKAAVEAIEALKKYSKAADGPASNRNAPEFLAYTKKITIVFEEFFELLRDVPDEI